MTFTNAERRSDSRVEEIENLSLEAFRLPLTILHRELSEACEEGILPDAIYCMDTLGRPFASAAHVFLRDIASPEDRPDIGFLAPSRELSLPLEDILSEEDTQECCRLMEKTRAEFLDLKLAELGFDYQHILEIALHASISRDEDASLTDSELLLRDIDAQVDLYSDRYMERQVKQFEDDPIEGELELLQAKMRIDRKIFKEISRHLGEYLLRLKALCISEKTKKIMLIDDCTSQGVTAMIFAILSKLVPDIKIQFFSAITTEAFLTQYYNPIKKELDFPVEFTHCPNFEFISGEIVPSPDVAYSQDVWVDPQRKQAMTGVRKDASSLRANVSPLRNGKAVESIRNKFKGLAEEIVAA